MTEPLEPNYQAELDAYKELTAPDPAEELHQAHDYLRGVYENPEMHMSPEEREILRQTRNALEEIATDSLSTSLKSLHALDTLETITPVLEPGLPTTQEEGGQDMLLKKNRRRQKAKLEQEITEEGVSQFKRRHLIMGDAQYPDVDEQALASVLKFNTDFKATDVEIIGDMMNATTLSKFGYPADYHFSFWDEVRGTRDMLTKIVASVRESNPEAVIRYYEGNHEFRLQRYLDKNGQQLVELEDSHGERVLSMPNLLNLKELGIEWIPYWEDKKLAKDVTALHGNIARVKAGYTAQAYIDRYGESAIAGHTHRLALVFRTQSGIAKFGMETGSLCKRKMRVPYIRENQADWQNGIGVLGVDQDGDLHPGVLPIVNGKIAFGGKVYKG